jgi:hypothetical protein
VELYLHSPNTSSWCGSYLSPGITLPLPLIKIVKTICNYLKVECGLEKCTGFSLEIGKDHRRQHMGGTLENEIKE